MDMADLDHCGGGFWFALIVLAVPSGTAVPCIRTLDYPAVAHGCEALASRGTGFHFDAPARTGFLQPGFESMIVILGIAKDCLQAGKGARPDLRKQAHSGKALAVKRVTENQGKQTPGVDAFRGRDFE